MDGQFIDLTPENLAAEHLCCIIRSKKPHPGVEAKALPCPFNNFAVFYGGKFQTVNLLDGAVVRRILQT